MLSRALICRDLCVVFQVLLKMDTTLANKKFTIQAFQSRVLSLGDKALATVSLLGHTSAALI